MNDPISLLHQIRPLYSQKKQIHINRGNHCCGRRKRNPKSNPLKLTTNCPRNSYLQQITIILEVPEHPLNALNLQTDTSSSAPRVNPPKCKITNQNEHLDAGMGIWITVTSQTTLPTGIIHGGSHGCEDSPKLGFIHREVQVVIRILF